MKRQDVCKALTELAVDLLVEAEQRISESKQNQLGPDGWVDADALEEERRTWVQAVDQAAGVLLAGGRLGLLMSSRQEFRRLATDRLSATERAAALWPAAEDGRSPLDPEVLRTVQEARMGETLL